MSGGFPRLGQAPGARKVQRSLVTVIDEQFSGGQGADVGGRTCGGQCAHDAVSPGLVWLVDTQAGRSGLKLVVGLSRKKSATARTALLV
jgi:hypothetical protein